MKRASVVMISGWAHRAGAVCELGAGFGPRAAVTCLALHELTTGSGGPGATARPLSTYATALCRYVQMAKQPLFLVGWSTGGMVALETAAYRGAEIAGLVLISSTPRFCAAPDFACGTARTELRALSVAVRRNPTSALIGFFAAAAFPRRVPKAHRDRQVTAVAGVGADALGAGLDYLRQTDLRPVLTNVACPVLVCHGKQDRIIPWQAGEFLANRLPTAEFCLVEGGGHTLPQSHVAQLTTAIQHFREKQC